jgi:hypothetical protein
MPLSLGERLVATFPSLLFLTGSFLKVFVERRSLRSIVMYENYKQVRDGLSNDFLLMLTIDSIFLFIANGSIVILEFEQIEIGFIAMVVGIMVYTWAVVGTYANHRVIQRYGVRAVFGLLGGELAYFCFYGTDIPISFIIPSVIACSFLERLNRLIYPEISERDLIDREWENFRDKIIETLEYFPNTKLIYRGDKMSSNNPSEFWDGILEIENKRVAINIHTGRQFMGGGLTAWRNRSSSLDRFGNRIRSTAKQAGIDLAFFVFDEDVRKRSEMSGYMSLLDTIVSESKKDLVMKILNGDPLRIAIDVYFSCA